MVNWQAKRDAIEYAKAVPAGPGRTLLRERYWELRHKIWEGWQALPDSPIVVRVLAGIIPIVLVTGLGLSVNTLFKSEPTRSQGEELAALLKRSAAGAPKDGQRLLVVGDFTAYAMALAVDGTYNGRGVRGIGYGIFGCGIVDGAAMVSGKAVALRNDCKAWRADFTTLTEQFNPTTTVLTTGLLESFDLVVNGKTLLTQAPDTQAYLGEQLAETHRILSAKGSRLLLATIARCSPGSADPRTEWINSVWRDYAKKHPDQYSLADLDAKVCQNGRSIDASPGNPVYNDEAMTRAGARYIWEWYSELARGQSTAQS